MSTEAAPKKGDLRLSYSCSPNWKEVVLPVANLVEARVAFDALALYTTMKNDDSDSFDIGYFDGTDWMSWELSDTPEFSLALLKLFPNAADNFDDVRLILVCLTLEQIRQAQALCDQKQTPAASSTAKAGQLDISVRLHDQEGGKSFDNIKANIQVNEQCIQIGFEGYGEKTAEAGQGHPVVIEMFNGHPRVLVWANINREDYTHVISLEQALESNFKG